MNYHLWCSSNSFNHESICLSLFQRTLTGSETKWYVELLRASNNNFNALETMFLTHYQLSIHYKTIVDILTSLEQYEYTHIYDHIHEWRH